MESSNLGAGWAPYSTTSLAQAAYLAVQGFTPRLVRVDENSVAFQFDVTESLLDEIARFKSGTGLVSPLAFDRARNTLRDAINDALHTGFPAKRRVK